MFVISTIPMLKYIATFLILIICAAQSKAQTIDNARTEFIEAINNFAKSVKYVQKIPQFKSGAGELYDYLQSHIIYPPKAKQDDLSAQVFVTFLVDGKTGLTKSIKVTQSSNNIFNGEAIRLIKTMPAWVPATQNDKDISMILTIPVYFHLN